MTKKEYLEQFENLTDQLDSLLEEEYEYSVPKYDAMRNRVFIGSDFGFEVEDIVIEDGEEMPGVWQIPYLIYIDYEIDSYAGIRVLEEELIEPDENLIHFYQAPKQVVSAFIEKLKEKDLLIDDSIFEDQKLLKFVDNRTKKIENELGIEVDKNLIFDYITEDDWATLFDFHFNKQYSFSLQQMYWVLDDPEEEEESRNKLEKLIRYIDADLKKRATLIDEEYEPLNYKTVTHEQIEWAVRNFLDYVWGNREPNYSLVVQHTEMWAVSRIIGSPFTSKAHFLFNELGYQGNR